MSLTQGADAVEAGIQKLQTTLQTYLGEKIRWWNAEYSERGCR